MDGHVTQRLMKFGDFQCSLPTDYQPVRPKHFHVEQIYLTRGSLATPERRRLVEEICNCYPEAETIECLDMPDNRIDGRPPGSQSTVMPGRVVAACADTDVLPGSLEQKLASTKTPSFVGRSVQGTDWQGQAPVAQGTISQLEKVTYSH